MRNSTSAIRAKLYDYIRVADDKKLHAIFNLLENEIEHTAQWWENTAFVKEIDNRYQSLENGVDKGFTIDEAEVLIDKMRTKKYGK